MKKIEIEIPEGYEFESVQYDQIARELCGGKHGLIKLRKLDKPEEKWRDAEFPRDWGKDAEFRYPQSSDWYKEKHNSWHKGTITGQCPVSKLWRWMGDLVFAECRILDESAQEDGEAKDEKCSTCEVFGDKCGLHNEFKPKEVYCPNCKVGGIVGDTFRQVGREDAAKIEDRLAELERLVSGIMIGGDCK